MEIFKIQRQGTGKSVTVDTVKEAAVVGDNDEVHQSEASELEQAKLLTGDKEVAGQKAISPDGAATGEESFSLGEVQSHQVFVKVDGPLSQVFTDSLNKVLAFENMVMIPMLAEEYERLKQETSFNDMTTLDVQAYDANELSTSDVVDITNHITKTTQEDHILAMESAQGVSQATGIAQEMCRSMNTRSFFRFNSAANVVLAVAQKAGI